MHRKFLETSILLATNNKYKVAELKNYFSQSGVKNISFYTPMDFSLSSPNETEETFIGNAELKARYYGNITGMVAIADDTGICINALDGFPGVHTADWINEYGDPKKLIKKVEEEIGDNADKSARAVCALSIYWPTDGHIESFLGETNGDLDFSYRDIDGMGFTRIFIPKGLKKPYALMTLKQKQTISHRGKAFAKLHKSCF